MMLLIKFKKIRNIIDELLKKRKHDIINK